jgi:tRNA A58 N-methylase Trm61
VSGRRVLLVRGNREFLLKPGETLESDLGVLELPEDIETGTTVETHLGEEYEVRRLRGPDLFDHLERTGAPMMPRDIGLVIGHTGVASDDRVLDAGTGTGVLAAYLGRLGVDVTTYERNAEFADVARENMELAGVSDHVDVRTGDLTEELDDLEETFDVVTLDTGDVHAVHRILTRLRGGRSRGRPLGDRDARNHPAADGFRQAWLPPLHGRRRPHRISDIRPFHPAARMSSSSSDS